MATKQTTTTTKASAGVQQHTVGQYKANPAWQAAHAAAKAAATAHTPYGNALQVCTHLAWRTPGGRVAWYAGTNQNMLTTANSLGIQPGQVAQQALAVAVAALVAAANGPAQAGPAATLAALVG